MRAHLPALACALTAFCGVDSVGQGAIPQQIKLATPTDLRSWVNDGQVIFREPIGTSVWLGLYPAGNSFEWRSTPVQVRWAPDPEAGEGLKTHWSGKKIGVDGKVKPIVLVQGLPDGSDVPRSTATYARSEAKAISAKGLRIDFGDEHFVLRIKVAAGSNGKDEMILSNGMRQQVIYASEHASDPTWELVWAGDVDGDGKLDLVISYVVECCFSETRLLLSGKSRTNELVHVAARREYVGE